MTTVTWENQRRDGGIERELRRTILGAGKVRDERVTEMGCMGVETGEDGIMGEGKIWCLTAGLG